MYRLENANNASEREGDLAVEFVAVVVHEEDGGAFAVEDVLSGVGDVLKQGLQLETGGESACHFQDTFEVFDGGVVVGS